MYRLSPSSISMSLVAAVIVGYLVTTTWSFQPSSSSYRKATTTTVSNPIILRMMDNDNDGIRNVSDLDDIADGINSNVYDYVDPASTNSPNTKKKKGRLVTVEYEVFPDGRFIQKVSGVAGPECLKLTETLEKAIGGTLISRELTEEYYQDPNTNIDVSISNTVQEQAGGTGDYNNDSSGTATW